MRTVFLLICAAFTLQIPSAIADTDVRRRAHAVRSTELNIDDIKAEISIGREIAARVLGREALFDNSELTRYVSLVGQALALNSGRPELQFYFAVLNSEHVNAYSSPGGYVFVTRGALKKMANEAELAAVLAHEIAHVQQRHIVNALNIRAQESDVLTNWMSVLVGGSTDATKVAFFQAVDKATLVLFEEGFNIRDELDSDRVAVALLANTGYDPQALHSYLERIDSDNESNESDASDEGDKKSAAKPKRTHPSSAERMRTLTETLNTHGLKDADYPRRQERFASYGNHF